MAPSREAPLAGRVLLNLQTYFCRRLDTLFAKAEDEIARDEFMRPQIIPPSHSGAGDRTHKH
jgi:hypothetical protein